MQKSFFLCLLCYELTAQTSINLLQFNTSKFTLDSAINMQKLLNDNVNINTTLTPIQVNYQRSTWDIIPYLYLTLPFNVNIGKNLSSLVQLRKNGNKITDYDYLMELSTYSLPIIKNLNTFPGLWSDQFQHNLRLNYLHQYDKIKLAVSYMPTTKPILLINSIPTITIANYQNIMQLGIEYKYKFNSKLQMKFAVSGEKSGYGYISYKVIDPMLDWFSGLNLRYMNLILGINHGYNNNYNTLYKNKPFNFNNITYKFGPFNFNLIQVKSKNTTKSIFDEKQINFTNQYFLTQYNYNNKINYYIQGGIIKISGVKTQNNAACGINIKF